MECMSRLRTGRRKYYDLFSHFYDAFIRLHARSDEDDTRHFLVEEARLEDKPTHRILDICCGTGSVILAFAERKPDVFLVGYDFSHGMIRKAQKKNAPARVVFVEGDASELPFRDESFSIVTCSHSLYELKGRARDRALLEMRRVLHADGLALLMEHEIPKNSLVKGLFYLRLFFMGSKDAREFLHGGSQRLRKAFPRVTVSHSPSGKSRLMICRK
jgi:ubiquinone/menaquinone biosynthesis C-methylase UbiE